MWRRAVKIWEVYPVRHEATGVHRLPVPVHRGEAACGRQRDEARTVRRKKGHIEQQQPVGTAHRLEGRLKVLWAVDRDQLYLHAEGARGLLRPLDLLQMARRRWM